MSDNRGSVFVSDAPDSRLPLSSPQAPVAPASGGDILSAHWTLGRQDMLGAPANAEAEAYQPIVDALNARDDRDWLHRAMLPDRFRNPDTEMGGGPIDVEAVWSEVARQREREPGFMKDIPAKGAADFSKYVAGEELRRRRSAQSVVSRQRGVAQNVLGFGADIATGFTDPINLTAMVLTGGSSFAAPAVGGALKTIALGAAREALVNGAIEVAELPVIAHNRAEFGEDFTPGEMLTSVGVAAAGGGVFHLGGVAASRVARAAGDAIVDSPLARPLLPMAARFASLSDAEVARRFALDVPAAFHTPDQQAALHVLGRQADVDAVNPFEPTPAARDLHADQIEAKIDAILAAGDPDGAPAVAARVGRSPAPALGRAHAALEANESGGRQFAADGAPLTSSAGAVGMMQVMPSTGPEAARLAGLPWDETRLRTDGAYNRALGRAYYNDLLRQFDGDAEKAAAAYNAGPGSAKRGTGLRGAIAKAEAAGRPEAWRDFLPAETRDYIAKFRRRMGDDTVPVIDGDPGATLGAGIDDARIAADMTAERVSNVGDAAPDPIRVDLAELRRDAFPDEASWRAAQRAFDDDLAGVERAVPEDVRGFGSDDPQAERLYRDAVREAKANGGDMIYHGTRGDVATANPNNHGMTFYALRPEDATRYAEAVGGGRRGGDGAPKILRRVAPRDDEVLDLTSAAGVETLASLPMPAGRAREWVTAAQEAIRRGKAPGADGTELWGVSHQVWSSTKNATHAWGDSIRREITEPLAAMGYRGIRFTDDSHPTIALFDAPREADGAVSGGAAADAGAEAGADGLGPPERAGAALDDPTGAGARAIADSLAHDVRAGVDRAAPDRDAPGNFRLDEGGDERTAAEVLAEIDADEAAIGAARACL